MNSTYLIHIRICVLSSIRIICFLSEKKKKHWSQDLQQQWLLWRQNQCLNNWISREKCPLPVYDLVNFACFYALSGARTKLDVGSNSYESSWLDASTVPAIVVFQYNSCLFGCHLHIEIHWLFGATAFGQLCTLLRGHQLRWIWC